jgi:predicted RNA-binding Zn-ribbon protein involved in translation (DUF1610 family)
MKDNSPPSNYDAEDEFRIESTAIEIHCPKCRNELVHDGNSLTLAESRTGASFECGRCGEISQWKFTLEPFTLEQVPITWGGNV